MSEGLYKKFVVVPVNDPEGKHIGCPYFVLDIRHDESARFALLAYAVSARRQGNQKLYDDIQELLRQTPLVRNVQDV